MHYTGLSVILFSLVAAAVGVAGGSIVPITSLRESCAGGSVLNTTTLHVDGKEVILTTKTCPGFVKDEAAVLPHSEGLEKRQTNVCTDFCTASCSTQTSGPNRGDCEVISSTLASQGARTFVQMPGTALVVHYKTCDVGFANLDVVPLRYCFASLGLHLLTISNSCFPSSHDGFCIPPQIPGRRWGIQAF